MKEIAISEFKAKCLAILARVEKTKQPIRITRHGKPVADITPAAPDVNRASLFGSMRNSIRILGDIVSPVIDLDEIEALRD
ncbi:MAG TPA: type II toxin-antitoxin system Phd/YefM family antitoxin [Methylomirabilota bacterium]|nr:type II toxin-antitoxin system Phd/YefM family antitoxin [Methylomirabilota bacterium]